MNKAVFLDKDGTLIVNVPYNVDPEKIKLENATVDGLKKLQRAGYVLIVISNQPGLALGYFSEFALQRANERLHDILLESGVKINATYYCPHHPAGFVKALVRDCSCRKPLPGLLIKAAADFNINLKTSWMVGDILHDVEAGNRAGCKTILVDNGNETEWKINPWREPTKIVSSINEAASLILSHTEQPSHVVLENVPRYLVHSCR